MSQKIDIRERRYNGVDYDILHPETNINMVLDSSNNSVGSVNGALYGDGNGNIVGATISNPNLLDNPWFTVNQRGFTSGTVGDYNYKHTVDRFCVTYFSDATQIVTLNSSGLSFNVATNDYIELYQNQENIPLETGKKYTVSVKLSDGTILSTTFTWVDASSTWAITSDIDFVILKQYSRLIIRIKTNLTIRAVKLEIGSISTLANDVAPDYGMELAKCQAYFVRIKMSANYSAVGLGFCTINNATIIFIPKPYNMRPITSINYSGSFNVYTLDASANYAVSNITLSNYTTNNIVISCSTNGTTTGTMYFLQANNDANAYIDLIADL